LKLYWRFGSKVVTAWIHAEPLLNIALSRVKVNLLERASRITQAIAHIIDLASGDVVQLVRTLPCHGRGRGFESRRPRHSFEWFTKDPENQSGSVWVQ
jgi:hypothetical protein